MKPAPEDEDMRLRCNELGQELMSDEMVAISPRFQKRESLSEEVKRLVAKEFAHLANAEDYGSFEDEDDFEVGDDYDPSSPYEIEEGYEYGRSEPADGTGSSGQGTEEGAGGVQSSGQEGSGASETES